MQKKTASKEGLRQAIIAKRHTKEENDIKIDFLDAIISKRHTKEENDIKIDFLDPANSEMTSQEKIKRERRKEQNRRAAQRCRHKKRQNQSKVLQTFQNILDSNKDLRGEMQILKMQRDNLQRAWTSHCDTCPLFAPGRCDESCVIKMRDVMSGGIKQEPPPLSDCMMGIQNSPPTAIGGNYAMKPPPYTDYVYEDTNYYGSHTYQQQQQTNQHYPQQHQQHQWSMTGPYSTYGSQYYHPLPDRNNNDLDPNTCSPNSSNKSLVPFMPHSNSNVLSKGNHQNHHNSIPTQSQFYEMQSKIPSKHISKKCPADTKQPETVYGIASSPSHKTKTAKPSPTLVNRYPDLCRQLKSTPSMVNNLSVPSFTRQIIPTQSTPGSAGKGISTSSSYGALPDSSINSVCQPSKPQLDIKTMTPSPTSSLKIDCNSPRRNGISNSPNFNECGTSTSAVLTNASTAAKSSRSTARREENRPLSSSCQYAFPCVNHQDNFFSEVRSRGSESSDIGSIPDNVMSIPRDVSSLAEDAAMEADDVFHTALDMEQSYSLGKSDSRPYNDVQTSIPSSISTSEYIEMSNRDPDIIYNNANTPNKEECTKNIPPGARIISANAPRSHGEASHTVPAIADDLSDILSKELLFFGGENDVVFPALPENNFEQH